MVWLRAAEYVSGEEPVFSGCLHPAGRAPLLSGVTDQVLESPFLPAHASLLFLLILRILHLLSSPLALFFLLSVFTLVFLLSFLFPSSPLPFSFFLLFLFIFLLLLFPLYVPSRLR